LTFRKLRVPASSANLGPGFDALGLALGVYLECRTISLSRNIPTGLGWIIRPMVSSLPRESLTATLESTVRALKP